MIVGRLVEGPDFMTRRCLGNARKIYSLNGEKCFPEWGKFWELLPLLNCKAISLKTHGQLYNSCVGGTILHSSEFWTIKQEGKKRLECSKREMLLCRCNMKKQRRVSINSLLKWLKLKSLDSVLRRNRLHWLVNVKQTGIYTGQILGLEEKGNRNYSLPKKCWWDAIKRNLRACNL